MQAAHERHDAAFLVQGWATPKPQWVSSCSRSEKGASHEAGSKPSRAKEYKGHDADGDDGGSFCCRWEGLS